MPIYEYRCSICNHQFESLQKVGARALTKCPECSGKLEKLISRTSFLLKGGGWFDQGYGPKSAGPKAADAATKPDGASKPAKADAPAPSAGSNSSETKKKTKKD